MDADHVAALPPAPPLPLAGRDGYRAPGAHVDLLPGPRGWPLLGNTPQLQAQGAHASMEAWARQYGALYRMRFGPYRAVGISEPGLIDQLLRHRPDAVSRSPRISRLIHETGFRGVFTAEGEAWRRQRRLVMRALTPEVIRTVFPLIATVTERLAQRWQEAVARGARIDVLRDLKCYSIDVTSWITMGLDLDTLSADSAGLQADVETWFDTVGRRLPAMLPYWRVLRRAIDRRSDAAVARLHATVDRLVADTRARMAAEPALRERPRNIVQALVAARDEPASGFSDEDVRGNVAIMLFAGEDTTANTMAWLLAHLAQAPAAQARARAEASAVLAGRVVAPDTAALDRLAYLEAAAVESMRLKPIAPVMGMQAQVDLDLAGAVVPQGHLLFLLPRVCALQEMRFAQAAEFTPERWLDAGAEEADTRRSMFPFGGGPRYCPGRYLAMTEIKVVLSMVLARFALQLDAPAGGIVERFGFTMAPNVLPLQFTLR